MLEIRANEIFTQKYRCRLQSSRSDALWWNLFLSRIFETAAVASFSCSAVEVSEAEQPVQCFSDDPGIGLPASAWARSPGNRVIPTFQWDIPIPNRYAKLSGSSNVETLPISGAGLVVEAVA